MTFFNFSTKQTTQWFHISNNDFWRRIRLSLQSSFFLTFSMAKFGQNSMDHAWHSIGFCLKEPHPSDFTHFWYITINDPHSVWTEYLSKICCFIMSFGHFDHVWFLMGIYVNNFVSFQKIFSIFKISFCIFIKHSEWIS